MDISAIDSNFAGAKAEGGYRWYDVTAAPQIRVFGVTFDKREGRFLRLPREVAAATSAGVNTLASCTAGGRVRFDANSDKIAIRAEINTVIAASHLSGLCSAGFSLYADLEDGGDMFVGAFRPDDAYTSHDGGMRYEQEIALPPLAMSRARKGFTLYMPLYGGVSKLEIGIREGKKLLPSRAEYAPMRPIVAYGSSITQGACASRPGTDYLSLIMRAINADYVNLGFSGNARGERAMSEYLASLDTDCYFLDYDYNSPPAELEKRHYPLYAACRTARPAAAIVLKSNVCTLDPADNEKRFGIIKATFDRARAEGDDNIYLADGRTMGGEGILDGTAEGIHPTDYGFRVMADALVPLFRGIKEKILAKREKGQ